MSYLGPGVFQFLRSMGTCEHIHEVCSQRRRVEGGSPIKLFEVDCGGTRDRQSGEADKALEKLLALEIQVSASMPLESLGWATVSARRGWKEPRHRQVGNLENQKIK